MKLFEIGQKIKELRKDKGFTQEQLATISGISRVTLGKLERGLVASVSIKTLDILLDALDYEIDFMKKNTESFGLPTLDELG
ncbi:helix-turn-helix transcriptional regulator [Sulfurimonas sp.]|uniref:helix-turn-helix domain-containing protein n=1 Tax=Sulfurimonas sp. TaxID=2022749 RepID=UPI00263A367D|nr:helix-turn-helix transcriptional regulator [Sulfurimonas sp.]MCW8895363.1 helix-turn-helix domain-containing protein [Sulfurimonas sp.]MCW9067506.1 helix-turn-helix domain-containing protein [Sulfurimonas sp.]